MRLSKGSGIDGLAAIAPSRMADGLRIVRPLLGFTRADLRQVCKDFGAEWVEDPSNANPQFLRVKLRQFEELLAFEGMTPQRLAQTLQKFAEARDALNIFATHATETVLRYDVAGFARLKLDGWRKLPADIQRRVLSSALLAVAPRDYAPGFEALDQARADMAADDFAGRTLSGCEIFKDKPGEAVICREAATASPHAPLANGLVWEGCFQVSGYRAESSVPPELEIGILGDEGLAILRQKNPPKALVFAHLENVPYKARRVLPALWKGQNLVSVPYLNWVAAGAPPEAGAVTVIFAPQAGKTPPGA
jgi:tRNA(Ile)-lysidine synthase